MAIGTSFYGIPSGTRYVKLNLGPTEAGKLYGMIVDALDTVEDKHIERIADALADAGVIPSVYG
jgi:hypothetical protein